MECVGISFGACFTIADFARICCLHAQYLKAGMAEEICCVLYHLDSLIDFEQQPMQAVGWEGSFTRFHITVRIIKQKICVHMEEIGSL